MLIGTILVINLCFFTEVFSQDLDYYYGKGEKCYLKSDFKCALSYWERGLQLARSMNHKQATGTFLENIGIVCWSLSNFSEALRYLKEALKIQKEVNNKDSEGNNLGNIGTIYKELGDYREALRYYEQALQIKREIGDKKSEGGILGNIGAVYSDLGNYPEALRYYEQALKIKKEIGDRTGEGNIHANIGIVYTDLGNYLKALQHLKQGLKLHREIGSKMAEGLILGNIGVVYDNLGEYPKARRYYEQSLQIKREIGDKKGEGDTFTNIGAVQAELDDYLAALLSYEQSLKIYREIGFKRGEGIVLGNIGIVYSDLGEYSRAQTYYEKSLQIKREIGDKRGEGDTLNNVGSIYVALGNYPEALRYYEQALRLKREIGERNEESNTLANIGVVHAIAGKYFEALEYYKQSLKIKKEIGVPTDTEEANIGDIYLEQGKMSKAYSIFRKLKSPIRLGRYYLMNQEYVKSREKFARSLEVDELSGHAGSILADYIGLGLSYEGLKDYTKAKEYYKKGIDLIEEQRTSLSGKERETFLAGKVMGFFRLEPYEGMVRVLMKESASGYEKKALSYAERAKSRVFLEMLAAKGLKGRSPQDKETLEKDREFQQDFLVLNKRIAVLKGLGDKAPKGEKENLEKELEKTKSAYERFIKEVKLKNSEIASLISVSPVSIEEVQSILDEDVTVLEYYTAQQKTYAWLVTKNDIKTYEINLKLIDLQEMADKCLIPNISNNSRRPKPVITLATDETYKKETSKQKREKNRKQFYQVAHDFYKLIMAPVVKDIKTEKLIIVPHGVLHKVPFAALNDGTQHLVDRYNLSVLPASSVIEYVVKKRNPNQKKLLAFANPIADHVPGFEPLPATETEVANISQIFVTKDTYYRREATEGIVKDKSSSPDVIHFACHGEFNDKQPLQSGLLLTKDKDNDGYLQVHEIFGLNLANANLVTLSACETALGKIQGGDDMVGLSRGFIYAGTPSLLATLWDVDDISTSILMKHFYENWQLKGMSKPEALRQAQIALKSIPDYKHPYHWAPFVMIGDWR